MKSFLEFILESDDHPQFKTDNPGGEWLKNKQKRAEENYDQNKGIFGSTTGYFTKNLKLPVHHLKDIPGAMGEEKHRNDFNNPKHKALSKSVAEHGFDTEKHPITIVINHRGKPHVTEGNHRLAHAIKHGHSHIHAEVRYQNGGEEVKGQGWHPHQVLDLHHHRGLEEV